MKVPATLNTYCPRCKSHKEHSITLYKKGKDNMLTWGWRRQERRKKGYGGQKYPMQRKHAKVNKKQTLKLTCKECGYVQHREGMRLKRIEIVR